jgi:outer membrane biosynthesis protein TonB
MSKKKNTPKTPAADLPALKIGSRVRCTDDGVQGRITWANAASVKIEWDDGEKVTWKRADLAGKGLEVLDADDAAGPQPAIPEMPPEEPPTPELASVEQAPATTPEQTTSEQTPPVEPVATEQAAVVEPAPAKKLRMRKAKQAAGDGQEKKLSALDAAAKILAEAGQPMNCQEMIDAMAAKGYWTSPGGKTPAATLYSAILRELSKGAESRFVKAERGKFGLKR